MKARKRRAPNSGSEQGSSPSVAGADRRVARGQRTRMALVDAVIDLMLDGVANPTSRQIAQHADVSVRTLYNHFRVKGLQAEAIAATVSERTSSIVRLPTRGPLTVRIGALCHQRRELLEPIERLLSSAVAMLEQPPVLADALDGLRVRLRSSTEMAFRQELDAKGRMARSFLDLLDTITGWESWNSYRFRHGLSAAAAERTLAALVASLLV
jgi:TetR/AcrR family transcriptional regulator, regulator of autoinduction and epiphytic fitness